MDFKHKPKVLRDLYSRAAKNSFKRLERTVNLQENRIFRLPLVSVSKATIVFAAFSYLVFGSALAPVSQNQLSLAAQNDEERRQWEKQLEELEAEIAKDQETLALYKSQGKTLQSEIDRLNGKINALNLQIKAVTLSLKKLDQEISLNKKDILTTEQKIDQNKSVLSRSLQNIYEGENISIAEILLRRPKLSDFFADMNDLFNIQESLRGTLEKVTNLRDELEQQKESLAIKKNDTEQLKAYQDSQRASLNSTKGEKAEVLKVTKGNEAKYQALVKEKQKTAAEIRNRIFRFLGGGELLFGDAVKIAKVAEKAIGVRAALTLAVLTQESAIDGVIGSNLGRCYYNDPRSNSSGSVMSNSQKPSFLALMSALSLDPHKTPVSCPIASDGTYGGAMGPAQFMPKTWDIYKDRISSITGGYPASPFNNLDAFTGTALYLSDGLSGCKTIYETIFSRENCAAAKYYAGGKWKSYTGVGRYGYRVADRASDFADDIAVLDAN